MEDREMVIQVAPDIERLIDEAVATGDYVDATDFVERAVRLALKQRRIEQIRQSVAESVAAIERGEGIEATPEFWASIPAEIEKLNRLDIPLSPNVLPQT
jgi:Arc/MetJ-type ribon-helix-helix transcriptional regulator